MTTPTDTQPVPTLDRLDADGIEAIHETSMEIIEEFGIQVNHDRALQILEDHGASVDAERIVTADRELIEDAVDDAPSSFTLYGRGPDTDLDIGAGDILRAPGYGPPNIVTHAEGRRNSQLADFEVLLKLAHEEDVINCAGYNLCEPNDVDQSVKHVAMLQRSLTMTDMPIMGSTYGEDRAETCMELLKLATDDPDLDRPYMAGLINTVPPRSLDTRMVGGLVTYAAYGQPTVISSFTMAGASGPATLAGSLAQANAENLLGIALTQFVNPGAPVVYGVPSSNIDIRYGSLSIGSAESALFTSFAGQMGRYYDIPSRGGGSLSDAKTVDYQAGFESMLTMAVTAFSQVDFVLHAAGILESYSAISPEKFVLDCELIRILDRFVEGYPIDEEHFALDVMSSVDPSGHFLAQRHTLEHAEETFYMPDIIDKRSHGDWEEDGSKTAFELGSERVDALLASYEAPDIDPDIESAISTLAEEAMAGVE